MATALEWMSSELAQKPAKPKLRLVHPDKWDVRVRDPFAPISDANEVTSIDNQSSAEMLDRFPAFQILGPTVVSLADASRVAQKFIKRFGSRVIRYYREESPVIDQYRYTLVEFAKSDAELAKVGCERFWK